MQMLVGFLFFSGIFSIFYKSDIQIIKGVLLGPGSFLAKIRLITKFMTSQPEKQAFAVGNLPNNSRRQSDNEIWSVNRM